MLNITRCSEGLFNIVVSKLGTVDDLMESRNFVPENRIVSVDGLLVDAVLDGLSRVTATLFFWWICRMHPLPMW